MLEVPTCWLEKVSADEERARRGARGEIVNEIAADVPPPGAGVNTVTGTDPAVKTSVARIVVLS